jgi:CRP-like cAMP-binding protein
LEVTKFKNTILKALDAETVARLRLRRVNFELKHEMEYPGRPIKYIYFVEAGMASMTTTFKDGSQVEVSTLGYQSIVGVASLMGSKLALNRVYTQIAGHGYYCPIETAKAEFDLAGKFQFLALRYIQAQLLQAFQSIGCNAKHNFEPRLARWLLICADRSDTRTFTISHTSLADMLGGTRATVSLAAGALKRKGLITYTRGVIKILDVPGLEKAACECYQATKDSIQNDAQLEAVVE